MKNYLLPLNRGQALFCHAQRAAALFIVCCLSAIHLHAKFRSQADNLVTMKLQDAPIEKAFDLIKQQTLYRVMYRGSMLKEALPVTINVQKAPLVSVLAIVFKDQPFGYKLVDNNIVVVPKAADIAPAPFVADTIKGKVVNDSGEPVIATISVKGTAVSTTTNEKGEFRLMVPEEKAILIITGVNIETQEVRTNREYMSIAVKKRIVEAEEVKIVSTGYQLLPKERATGSYVQLDNELINRSVSTNILDRIYNITSGLNYTPNATAEPVFSIRGISSINSNKLPLVVIDGFAYDDANFSGPLEHIKNINPADIESITILKDAAAASIWGARAGNGVIVLNTKKGKFNQKAIVKAISNITIGDRPDIYKLRTITSNEAIDFEKNLFLRNYYQEVEDLEEANYYSIPLAPVYETLISQRRGILTQEEADSIINDYRNHDIRSDVNKYILQKSINQQYAINVSGGSGNHNYFMSAGYDNNIANVIGNKNNRITLRIDNSFRLNSKIELNTYISYTQQRDVNNPLDYYTLINGGPDLVAPPYSMLADAAGNPLALAKNLRLPFVDNPTNPDYLDWHYRPLQELRNGSLIKDQVSTRLGTQIKYTIIKGLDFEIKGQIEKGITNGEQINNLQTFSTRNLINKYMFRDAMGQLNLPVPMGAVRYKLMIGLKSWNVRAQLNFNHFWKKNQLSVIAGEEIREMDSEIEQTFHYGYNTETNLFSKNIDYKSSFAINPDRLSTAFIPNLDGSGGILNRYVSYYSNASYTYNAKYTLSISGRKDGANLLGLKTNQKVAPLCSSGMSWVISKEPFYRIKWIPYLKARITYGYNGNIKNDATTYAVIRYLVKLPLNNQITADLLSPPNPSLTWERIKIINFGLDFGNKNGRISGSIEYYKKDGLNLIGPVTAERTSGVSSYTGNNASIKGKGFDLVLNTTNIAAPIVWMSSLILSYNTDKVTSYNYLSPLRSDALIQLGTPYIGKPLYSIFSYKWAGLDPIDGSPRGFLKDKVASYQEVLGITSNILNTKPEDLIYQGSATPQYFGSFRNTFKYKNFDISANITFKLNYYFRRPSIDYTALYAYWNGHADYSARWKQPGDELKTNIPSLPMDGNDYTREQFYRFSEVLVEKGDHIRLQDVRLGYTLNSKKIRSTPFKSLNVFLYANNLGIIWRENKLNIDPDAISIMPVSKGYTLGLSVGL